MSITLKIGATLSGGTNVVAVNNGTSGEGSNTFALPTNTRLLPRTIKFFTNIPATTASNPGTARAGARMILGNRVSEEGCCTVTPGTVIVNVDVAWPLSQPAALVDEAIAELRALVYTDEFAALVKNGMLPV